MSQRFDFVNSTSYNISFAIEEGLGKNTTFTFITPTIRDVQLQLNGPNDYELITQSHGSIATLTIPGIAQVSITIFFQGACTLQYKCKNPVRVGSR